MQRDTHLTFREIHGDEHELARYIDHIRTHALYKVPAKRESLHLRLLVPYDPPLEARDDTVYLRLIDADESAETSVLPPYITVSYTWKRSDTEEDIPDYRIARESQTGDAKSIQWSAPRCPPIVLHRAVRYAKEMVRLHSDLFPSPYIWIDQECIEQNDPEDVHRHLEIMEMIYRKSFRTVAILSVALPSLVLDLLAPIPLVSEGMTLEGYLSDILKMLRHVEGDPWFGRTWTYHEQECASIFRFLAPIDVDSNTTQDWPTGVFDQKYLQIRGSRLARKIDVLCSTVTSIPEYRGDTRVQDMASNITRTTNYILSTAADRAGRGPRPERIPILLFENFERIERKENSVVSDRLAIFANSLNLPFKLKTTTLQSLEYSNSEHQDTVKSHSYSTCMLVLLIANISHKTIRLSALQPDFIMDRTISDVMQELKSELLTLLNTPSSILAERWSGLWQTLRLDVWEDHPAIQRSK